MWWNTCQQPLSADTDTDTDTATEHTYRHTATQTQPQTHRHRHRHRHSHRHRHRHRHLHRHKAIPLASAEWSSSLKCSSTYIVYLTQLRLSYLPALSSSIEIKPRFHYESLYRVYTKLLFRLQTPLYWWGSPLLAPPSLPSSCVIEVLPDINSE
jgi:hypothetical protein